MPKQRTPKGECSIVTRSGRLRLRIPRTVSPDGKQQEIALGMADTPAARTVAAQILADLQLDIYTSRFDYTLAKYKRKNQIRTQTIYGLWCRYVEYKKPGLNKMLSAVPI